MAILVLTGWVLAMVGAEDGQADRMEQTPPFPSMVGEWRGVGQPRRGSRRGAWRETSSWSWRFEKGLPRLQFESQRAKYFSSGTLAAGDEPGQLQLKIQPAAGGPPIVYRGRRSADRKVQLETLEAEEALPDRVTIRQIANGDRMVILLERRTSSGRFTRIAELGYTRVGSGFGKEANYVECVVTGGLGTIPVVHNGQTYYVCCTGCRDYFQQSPEEILAEYRARQAAASASHKNPD